VTSDYRRQIIEFEATTNIQVPWICHARTTTICKNKNKIIEEYCYILKNVFHAWSQKL